MVDIPSEQLDAITRFWAEKYQLEATPEQLENFQTILREEVLNALQECTWDESNPLLGEYGRNFITANDYQPTPALGKALIAAGLKSGTLSFPWKITLSINPGIVKVLHSNLIVWQASNSQV